MFILHVIDGCICQYRAWGGWATPDYNKQEGWGAKIDVQIKHQSVNLHKFSSCIDKVISPFHHSSHTKNSLYPTFLLRCVAFFLGSSLRTESLGFSQTYQRNLILEGDNNWMRKTSISLPTPPHLFPLCPRQ